MTLDLFPRLKDQDEAGHETRPAMVPEPQFSVLGHDSNGALSALHQTGFAIITKLFTPDQCRAYQELYDDPSRFRSHIHMARHGFGQGEYRYFRYPLPLDLQTLRAALYLALGPIANDWMTKMGKPQRFPLTHTAFLETCHQAGQVRPTPLLLRYKAGDYNCLHQDLYGDQVFPLQAAILLSQPGRDFTGGEFVLTEQRPRQQSRVTVVPLDQGDMVVFAVNTRPHAGTKGPYQVKLRHGVSQIRSGHRMTLGVILHDAL